MKRSINNFLVILSMALFFTACEKNDLVDDLALPGYVGSSVYWEVPVVNINAGDEVDFQAQYWDIADDIRHLSVWYDVVRTFRYSFTNSLSGFVFTYDSVGLARESQMIESYKHAKEAFSSSDRAYLLHSSFPTSYTLSSLILREAEMYSLSSTHKQLVPSYVLDAFYSQLFYELEFSHFQKILVDDLEMVELEWLEARFEEREIIPDDAVEGDIIETEIIMLPEYEAELLALFNEVEFSYLVYDAQTQFYRFNYSSVYSLNSVFKIENGEGVVNKTDVVTIELR